MISTGTPRSVRVAYLLSHPIQYQVPLLRRISAEPGIDLTVFYASDFSAREYRDLGFGVQVDWGMPLLEGYRYQVLPSFRDARKTGPFAQINYGLWSRLYRHADAGPYDVLWVHGYSTFTALTGILAAKSLGIPVLLRAESRHRKDVPFWRRAFKRLFFTALQPLIDAVLPIGSANAAFWSEFLGDAIPQYPMPYAVDNTYFQRCAHEISPQRQALLDELGLDPARPILLCVSKLQPRKRCSDLIEAYRLLLVEENLAPPPYLLFVGDGEQRDALERQARESGCEGICFCGFRNQLELPAFFDIATALVLPSEDEQWGLVVNEAMNAACPVIVSNDVGCQPDLIHNGVHGCVFPAGDVQGLKKALHKVLEDPAETLAMGERALEHIQTWSFEEDVRGLRQAITGVTEFLQAAEAGRSKPATATTAMLDGNT